MATPKKGDILDTKITDDMEKNLKIILHIIDIYCDGKHNYKEIEIDKYYNFKLKDGKTLRIHKPQRFTHWVIYLQDCHYMFIDYILENDFNEIHNIILNHYKNDLIRIKNKLDSIAKSMKLLGLE